MTAQEVAIRFDCNPSTVRHWAAKNNVARKLSTECIMAFDFSEEDCQRFAERKRPGWKKGKPRKKE